MSSFRTHVRTLRKKIRYGYVRLLRSPGAPREVAGGMALGLFISMLPAIQMPLALLAVEGIRRIFGLKLSRVAAVTGVWLTNPVTGTALYGLAWLVGKPVVHLFLPGAELPAEGIQLSLSELAALGPFALQIILALVVGGIICGVPIALAGYHLTLRAVERYQQRRAERRLRARAAPAMA
jgi:uncharacterized protein